MTKASVTFFLVFWSACQLVQAQSFSFTQKLEEEMANFGGETGLYVEHLASGEIFAIRADSLFPTASVIKVPIMVGIFKQIHEKKLELDTALLYRDSIRYGGSGLMQYFKDSTETDLATLLSLMIGYSDNTASLWCQELAGGGQEINKLLDSLGLEHTRVNSRTAGRQEAWEKYGWGQTSPREMVSLLRMIRHEELFSPELSQKMYRLMSNVIYDNYALSAIPPYIQTASKQGMVSSSRSELVMVNGPSGDYVFYIATKNNRDTSWDEDNEAYRLQRKLSGMLWNYFEAEQNQ
ncbi:beta-lactamase class A [Cyclobacterium xiamenense]|uniref:Beta-lactamase class A n=1 Tax=Cyclobacterium xiamenense TaxID=1297121 RepID=A0A1H6T4C9_9BACT|nr:serine hydrolase [Cyclobacterium xiamenense]SEI72964.1 beta-lactamase class A [Cyclobacterium xiamenense]